MIRPLKISLICCLLWITDTKTLFAQETDWDAKLDRFVQNGVESLKTDEEIQEAEEFCRRYVSKFEEDKTPNRQIRITRALLFRGQIIARSTSGKAISVFRQGLIRNPDDPDLNREMGLAFLAMTKYSEAEPYLEKAVSLNHNDLHAWQALIEITERIGNSEQKTRAYTGYLSIDSVNTQYWTKLGSEYLNLGRNDEAKKAFAQTLKIDPRQTSARLALASLKEQAQDWAGAVNEYEAILSFEPSNTIARSRLTEAKSRMLEAESLSRLLDQANRLLQFQDPILLEQSRRTFDSLLVRSPNNASAQQGLMQVRKKLYDLWFRRGLQNELSSNFTKALDCFIASLVYADSEPDRQRAFEKQKLIALKLGKIIEVLNARDAARRALETGEFNEALRKLSTAAVLDSSLALNIQPLRDSVEITENYEYGFRAYTMGDYELARAYFMLVMSVNPRFKDVEKLYTETRRRATTQLLFDGYEVASNEEDWSAARTYLLQLVELDSLNSYYATTLELVNRKIILAQLKSAMPIVVVIGSLLASSFAIITFRRRSRELAELAKLQSGFHDDKKRKQSYRKLNSDWQKAIDALRHQNSPLFWDKAITLCKNVVRICGIEVSFDHIEIPSSIDHFLAVSLKTTALSIGTRLPANLPLILFAGSEMNKKTQEKLFRLVDEHAGSSHRSAVMILFCQETDIQSIKQSLREKAQQVLAYDIATIDINDLRHIVTSIDPFRTLRKLILSQVDLSVISTFATTGPTPDDMFFGREAELREIVQRLREKNYALIGGRRIGKTSIIHRLHRVRLPAAHFRTIFHDCSTTTYEDFLTANIRDWKPEPPPHAPVTFGELIASPTNGLPLALLLDEADKLVPHDRENGWRLFNALRGLVNSGGAQIVLSGERTLHEALRDSTSPLFNLTNEIIIGRLDKRAVEELVTSPMKQLEIELVDETELVKRIYNFTSGHPNVVQRFCHRLVERLNEQGTRKVTIEEVDAVLADPGFQRDDFLSTFWEGVDPLEKIISLLIANDESISTLSSVRETLNKRCNLRPHARQVDAALQRLVDLRSILARTPQGYAFAVRAFPLVVANTTTARDMLEVLSDDYEEQDA